MKYPARLCMLVRSILLLLYVEGAMTAARLVARFAFQLLLSACGRNDSPISDPLLSSDLCSRYILILGVAHLLAPRL